MIRRLWLTSSLVVTALTGPGTAQSFTGDYQLHAKCATSKLGSLGGGCQEESQAIVGQCSTPTCGINAISAASMQRVVGPGALSSSVTVDANQPLPSPCGGGPYTSLFIQQQAIATDMVFRDITNPGATGPIQVSCNMSYNGTYVPAQICCIGCWAHIGVSAGVGSGFFSGSIDPGGAWTGSLTGYPNDDSTVTATSNLFTVFLGQSNPFFMRLEQNFGASLCEFQGVISSHGEAKSTLTCARSGPVFNLPPNITVDSAEFGIVDNHWVVADTDGDGLPDACEACPDPTTYCTASTTSIASCSAAIGSTGSPRLGNPSGFQITSGSVPGGNLGILYFSDQGQAAIPFGTSGGFVCAGAPTFRSAVKPSGGTSGVCDGNYAFTLQDLLDSGPSIVVSGATLDAGIWFRDPGNLPDAFGLSNGIELEVCP